MGRAEWQNWTNFLLGIWYFFTPWAISNSSMSSADLGMTLNHWIVGAMVAVAAGLALQSLHVWEEWVNLVLGVWIILSPWMMNFSVDPVVTWNSIVVGSVVALMAGISIPVARQYSLGDIGLN